MTHFRWTACDVTLGLLSAALPCNFALQQRRCAVSCRAVDPTSSLIAGNVVGHVKMSSPSALMRSVHELHAALWLLVSLQAGLHRISDFSDQEQPFRGSKINYFVSPAAAAGPGGLVPARQRCRSEAALRRRRPRHRRCDRCAVVNVWIIGVQSSRHSNLELEFCVDLSVRQLLRSVGDDAD